MTFPAAGAQIFYNEAGEVLGWDYPDYDAPIDPDEYDDYLDSMEEEDGY